ncbi:DNA replication terminus site-binding protein (plasmid) [Flagellatimonas centrodinii]|uniref:DNA replication terminus site-binding protein n=1 Tax=Flagellatimonas centrodinii TaxID=2806210 RepID=UPI001FFBF030|nr:DNA replication terminus site-binding protein [Flagellatimonas centrodinii]ULQ48324.1 DNA replication terminus site-binding protein [Flagellatimonas centrodinii]
MVEPEVFVGLLDAYDRVRGALSELSDCVRRVDGRLPAYAAVLAERDSPAAQRTMAVNSLEGEGARNWAAAALSLMNYRPGQAPVASVRAPGLLACSPQTLEALEDVNRAKKVFAERGRAIDEYTFTQVRKMRPFAHVQRLQVYRQLHMLQQPPERVSFFWNRGATTGKRLTVADVRRRIQNAERRQRGTLSDETIERELAALEGLHDAEVLVIRKPVAPHVELLVWIDGEPLPPIPGALPLFIPAGRWPGLNMLSDLVDVPTSRRSDRKVELEPLLPRLHVYRYLYQHRERQASKSIDSGTDAPLNEG